MDVVHTRCAGLDVHKEEVVACVRVVTGRSVQRTRDRFPTTTRGLLALADWLAEHQCGIVALEATGVYWKPVWHVLEATVELLLANPAHVRAIPGRKSDMNEAEIGVDMGRFPTPGHLRSWVGLCPRLDESAGKRRSTRIRHGAPWLKTVLVQAAWTAVRNREGYPHAQVST